MHIYVCIKCHGTSLAVQWLGLHAFTAGAWIQSLVRELRFGEWHDGAMNKCLQTVVLENTLETPLDSKEIKPILKEINPEYSVEGLMLKPKL